MGCLLTRLTLPLLVVSYPSTPRCHQGWVHFVDLRSAVSTGSYVTVEVSFTINGMNYLPGTVTWYPKDVSVGFFSDTNPSNYYAVIGKPVTPFIPFILALGSLTFSITIH